jgi:formylglycine-generating enzyme required for sulfatase activity
MDRLIISSEVYFLIPQGPALIGSLQDTPGAFSDEFPQHTINFPYDYWCARFPVTNSQFGIFVEETGYTTLAEKIGWAFVFNPGVDKWEKAEGADWRHPTGPESGIEDLGNHPAVSIGLFDAQAYTDWLNQKLTHELPRGYKFGLPTEVEWEKAARGTDGRSYPWGEEFNGLGCWYESREEVGTMSVGSFSPAGDSPYGCADMAGNTWDWTTTLWGPDKDTQQFKYPYTVSDGREDQVLGKDYYRVIRGGSFKNNPEALRCACRDIDPVTFALNNLGFRVFITPVE